MVNIIMPAYYGGNLLRDALASLTAQSKRNFVVTVVDDCSPNNIEAIVNEYENKLHINYIRSKENGGPGLARQAGLDFCDEKWFNYVMFMDEDDSLPPWSVELLSKAAIKECADIISAPIIEQKLGKVEIIPETNTTWLHGKIYRLTFLRENNIRFVSALNEDAAFNAQCQIAGKKKGVLDIPMYYWKNNKESLTRGQDFVVNQGYSFCGVLSDAMYEQRHNFKNEHRFVIIDLLQVYKQYYYLKSNPKISEEKVGSNEESMRRLFSCPETIELLNNEDILYYLAEEVKPLYRTKDSFYFIPPFNEFLEKFSNPEQLTLFKK